MRLQRLRLPLSSRGRFFLGVLRSSERGHSGNGHYDCERVEMTIETLLLPLLSGAIGWALRHYGIVDPTAQTPQSRQGAGGAVLPGPAQASLSTEIQAFVKAEVEKAVAGLMARLLPTMPAPAAPQSKA